MSWLRQDNGLLWIKGHPEAGKSTLMKYALRGTKQCTNSGGLVVSFFFHGRGVELQKSALGLFRSLLHQILYQDRDLLLSFTSLYRKRCESQGKVGRGWNWHVTELQEFLETVLLNLSKERQLRIFVDALDECGDKIAVDLVKHFYRWTHSSPEKLRLSITFSCRHYPLISPVGGLEIYVENENHADITRFVRGELEAQLSDAKQAHDLAGQIFERASGIFQWVVLVVPMLLELLANGYGMQKVQKRLSETPSELNDLYTRILQDLKENDMANSLKLMQWVCFARGPLSLE